jgi:TonB family protein
MNTNQFRNFKLRVAILSIIALLVSACTTTRTPFHHTVVDSNRGTISISSLTVENPGVTPGELKRGAGSLRIEYPDMCWNAGIDGTVILYIDIGDDGDPVDAKITRGIGGGCDEAALRAFRNTEYEPARNPEGDAIETRHWVTVIFSR